MERELLNHRKLSGHPNIVQFKEVSCAGLGVSQPGSGCQGCWAAGEAGVHCQLRQRTGCQLTCSSFISTQAFVTTTHLGIAMEFAG